MRIVDANIVLRYLLEDHESLSKQAAEIIDSGQIDLPVEVLCEVVFANTGLCRSLHVGYGLTP